MPVPITAIYAAILALVLTVLSAKAGLLRGKLGIPAGDGNNDQMILAMRTHPNAAEYIPIAIILMMILEMNVASTYLLHGIGAALVIARIAHPLGISNLQSPMRLVGAGLTALTIVVSAVLVLWQAFF